MSKFREAVKSKSSELQIFVTVTSYMYEIVNRAFAQETVQVEAPCRGGKMS
jgi:hypothetical protein